jgi:ribonuclease BN (tRNA processing enzyme)
MAPPASLIPQEIRVRLLPSSAGTHSKLQFANTLLVNRTIAIDAGSIGFNGTPEEQGVVRNVLLTHSHADHIASLPMLLINDYRPGPDCIRVWATEQTKRALREYVFNGVIWPDLEEIGTPESPFIQWGELIPGEPVVIEGLRFTPVLVNHTVETLAFLVESGDRSVVIGGDSAPTEELWRMARELDNLKAVFLEASFPNDELELAEISKHLRPETFAEEVAKMPAGMRFYAVHLKPGPADRIEEELAELGNPNIVICEPGKEYPF